MAPSESIVDAVKQGLSSGDHRSVNRAADKLKASAGVFGALRVAELCRALEEQSADGLHGASDLPPAFDGEDLAARAEHQLGGQNGDSVRKRC